jgi:uncharacterized protein with von Willebrand factor type A (vWA) domain
MTSYHYSRWDGTQNPFAPEGDELFNEVADSLFKSGDLEQSLRELLRSGMQSPDGQKMPGLQDLVNRLRRRRNQQLERFDMDSVMEDLRERMRDVVRHERQGAEASVRQAEERMKDVPPELRDQMKSAMDLVRKRADTAQEKLDNLPPSVAGSVKELSDHDFIDSTARDKFQELLAMLRKQMMSTVAKQAAENLQKMGAPERQELREMMHVMSDLMEHKLRGASEDQLQSQFEQFIDRFGQNFGDNPPQNLDELLDHLQQQLAQAQSLMAGMSQEERQQLMNALAESMDQETLQEMARMASMLEQLRPTAELARAYPFMGEESLTLDQAMDLMGQLQQMDMMERSLQQAGRSGDLNSVDAEHLGEMLGEDARKSLDQLGDIAKALEEMGYIQRSGDTWKLTARAVRKLADKALREVFGSLAKSNLGGHRIAESGQGGESTGETKQYEYGETFRPNLGKSLMNAVFRGGPGTPVHFELADFEVDRTEHTVSAATVLLLDQSSSMFNGGRWAAAKKVIMALQSLIQGQFPRDRLYVVGFSDHAEEIQFSDLPELQPNMWLQGTNMHHALMLARRILTRERAGTRQIIMVTDGEPTAHLEGGVPYFNYPPTHRTISLTLEEVKRCTTAGIVINSFMLERTSYLTQFIDYVSRINRGRAFYSSPENLGEYILIDYINNRRKRVA